MTDENKIPISIEISIPADVAESDSVVEVWGRSHTCPHCGEPGRWKLVEADATPDKFWTCVACGYYESTGR